MLADKLGELLREIETSPTLGQSKRHVPGLQQLLDEIHVLRTGVQTEGKNDGQMTHAINTYRHLARRAKKMVIEMQGPLPVPCT